MAKNVKKVNPKDTAKNQVMEVVTNALVAAGYEVEDGAKFGFTQGTVVVHGNEFDIQVKPIAPKTGVNRYEVVE
jgi:hypothetical protein